MNAYTLLLSFAMIYEQKGEHEKCDIFIYQARMMHDNYKNALPFNLD